MGFSTIFTIPKRASFPGTKIAELFINLPRKDTFLGLKERLKSSPK
jgi:hypothetical protein